VQTETPSRQTIPLALASEIHFAFLSLPRGASSLPKRESASASKKTMGIMGRNPRQCGRRRPMHPLRLISSLPVQVTVDGSASDLSAGRIQGVQVTGKGWASPRGLTCRTISANVGKTGIDVDALFKVRLPGTWHCIGTACAAVMQHHGGNRQHPASSFFWYQISPQQDITILHIKVFCNV
jgi:hypothetical protein